MASGEWPLAPRPAQVANARLPGLAVDEQTLRVLASLNALQSAHCERDEVVTPGPTPLQVRSGRFTARLRLGDSTYVHSAEFHEVTANIATRIPG